MIVEKFFEDFEIGSTSKTFGRTITETDFVVHAGHTGDFFPHHIDAEWCAEQDIGQRIAHGTMVFAIGVGLTASVINPQSISYGYDRLRFVRPVHIGDTITSHITVSDKRDHPKRSDHGILVEFLDVKNQRDETVLCCEHLYLVKRRSQTSI